MPVTATRCPPVSSPGVRTSRTARREGEAGRRTTDGAGVDGDVDRQIGTDDAVLGRDADDGPARIVLGWDRGDVHVDPRVAARRPLHREGVGGTRSSLLQQQPHLVGLVDGFTIDGDDHVVETGAPRGRTVVEHVSHDGAGRVDVDLVAEPLERHGDRDELRRVHELRVVPAVLLIGPTTAHGLLGQHVDVVVEPPCDRLEQRGRSDAHGRVGDRLARWKARDTLHPAPVPSRGTWSRGGASRRAPGQAARRGSRPRARRARRRARSTVGAVVDPPPPTPGCRRGNQDGADRRCPCAQRLVTGGQDFSAAEGGRRGGQRGRRAGRPAGVDQDPLGGAPRPPARRARTGKRYPPLFRIFCGSVVTNMHYRVSAKLSS